MLHLNKYITKKIYIQYKNHIFIMGDKMKLFFKLLALSTIVISLYLNMNNLLVVKNVDEILNQIINYAKENNQKKIDYEIIDDTILIGQKEKKVNIKKSYINMKQIGFFDEKFIIYEENKESLKKYIRYKIIGAKTDKKEISIIILLNEEDKKFSIENLSYFADGYWYEENKVEIDGITGYNFDYKNSNIPWLTYEALKYNNTSFCLSEDCSLYGLYTIDKNIIYNNFFYEIKNNIKPGAIFVFDNNINLKKEIEIIVNYVKNQGYQIKKIENLLNR